MRRNNLIALLFFTCGSLLIWMLDVIADRDKLGELQLETRITAEQLHLRLQSCLAPRLTLIDVLSDGWGSWTALENGWRPFASTAYRVLPGVQALNLVDRNYTIRQIYPVSGNEQALGANLSQHPNPEASTAIRQAEQLGILQRTSTLELLQSGTGIAFYKVIRNANAETLGFVNGVFRIEELFSTCFAEQDLYDRYVFHISEVDGSEIYKIGDSLNPAQENWGLGVASTLDVAGRPWLLELAPDPQRIAMLNSLSENLWLVLGIFLVFLLALATRAALNSRESLKISMGRYRLLVENQSDLIVKMDPTGKFLYASPNFCDLIGKGEGELLNSSFLDIVGPDNKQAVRDSLKALSFEHRSNIQVLRTSTDSESRWIEWSSSAVLDEQDKIQSIIAVGRDVTEQKAMESQIAHAQKMRAVGELAGGISHDFNNLLQIILANIELLLLNPDGTDREKRLQNIRSAVSSGIELTSRLSTLSKQDSVTVESVSLNQLLKETTLLVEKSLPSSIVVSCELPQENLLVKANWSQLERVLFNLCFNARDAIKDNGSIKFELREVPLEPELLNAYKHLHKGNYARISVTDTGCGMKADILPRIFEPFFSTKQKEKGTGLGLANCYSIINQSGGVICVDSIPGIGTRFDIYLPLMKGTENEENSVQPESPN